MNISTWTAADSNRAQQIWSEYQQHHDVSEKVAVYCVRKDLRTENPSRLSVRKSLRTQ